MNEGCEHCIVFKAKALKCFEMSDLPKDTGYSGVFCTSTCQDCPYFVRNHLRSFNLLIITENQLLRDLFVQKSELIQLNVDIASYSHDTLQIKNSIQPDVVIIDSSLGNKKVEKLLENVQQVPQISQAKIVIALPKNINYLLCEESSN